MRRPGHATVVAYLALFIALSSGAWAAVKIGSTDIKRDAVLSKHVKADALTASDIDESTLGLSQGGGAVGPAGPTGPAGTQGPPGPPGPDGPAGGDLTGDYPDPTIAANAVGTAEVDSSLTGADIVESSLGQVPNASQAGFASSAGFASAALVAQKLDLGNVYVKTASVVVPGGSQDDGNGNGVSRAVSVFCNIDGTGFKDTAMGGGAVWSDNANSNSDELENRIHSATFLDDTGAVAANGAFPFGYRVRGEVDKDGDDTLTVQVVCYPAYP